MSSSTSANVLQWQEVGLSLLLPRRISNSKLPEDATTPNPFPRRYFTATTLASDSQNTCLVFGGNTEHQFYSNELFEINVDARTAQLIETRGEIPCERYMHAAVVSGHHLLVHGGYNGSYLDDCSDGHQAANCPQQGTPLWYALIASSF